MLVVGMCGGSGAGKNTAARAFSAAGIPCLDADEVYHRLIAGDTPLARALALRFGEGILRDDGSVDRARLSSIVFAGGEAAKSAREDLNRIAHGEVLAECRVWLAEQAAAGRFAAIINAPLLFESGFSRECDLLLAVLAPQGLRIERVCKRDAISPEAAKRRLDAQLSDEFLRTHCDLSLVNDATEDVLRSRVTALVDTIKNIAKEQKNGS